jgi:hypothetical protein
MDKVKKDKCRRGVKDLQVPMSSHYNSAENIYNIIYLLYFPNGKCRQTNALSEVTPNFHYNNKNIFHSFFE